MPDRRWQSRDRSIWLTKVHLSALFFPFPSLTTCFCGSLTNSLCCCLVQTHDIFDLWLVPLKVLSSKARKEAMLQTRHLQRGQTDRQMGLGSRIWVGRSQLPRFRVVHVSSYGPPCSSSLGDHTALYGDLPGSANELSPVTQQCPERTSIWSNVSSKSRLLRRKSSHMQLDKPSGPWAKCHDYPPSRIEALYPNGIINGFPHQVYCLINWSQ